ncbi:MAG TPA: rRNA pseudouridine synthase [Firmicutes bacterium]|nr:rRNA pseudouridine synthase [Bacillota bacterium]
MEKIRLQKIIADSGFCSRRKAENLIERGKVQVDGHPVKLGDKADPSRSVITVDGQRLYYQPKRQHRYLMMYKPRGYVCTMCDEKERRCVADLLNGVEERVFPVGRLDVNSEGLLLFTTDGNFANDLIHPSRHVSKTYRVTVRPDVTDEQAALLSQGILIEGRMTAPAEVRILSKEPNRVVMEIVLREGRNRQIRKMCESLGLEVAKLKRISIGPLKLGMLKPGTYRDLYPEELKALRTACRKGS